MCVCGQEGLIYCQTKTYKVKGRTLLYMFTLPTPHILTTNVTQNLTSMNLCQCGVCIDGRLCACLKPQRVTLISSCKLVSVGILG